MVQAVGHEWKYATRKLGVEEWLVQAVMMALYSGVRTGVEEWLVQ